MAYTSTHTDEKLIQDYHTLVYDYQRKVTKYIKNLLTIQRAERKAEVAADRIHAQEEKEAQKEINEKYEAAKDAEGKVHCSFCGKSQDEVRNLIAAPDAVFICDGCINICTEIMQEELGEDWQKEYGDKHVE